MADDANFEFNRRKKAADGHEIIDSATYNKLTKKFLRHGGIIIRGEEAERYLKARGAFAAYIAGENVAVVSEETTVSDVLEEMYHAEQERKTPNKKEKNCLAKTWTGWFCLKEKLTLKNIC